jgi:hypothetical protein
MPGFILNVQGLEVLFKVLDGAINTANRIVSVFLENASPGLTGETRSPGQVMSAIGIGDDGFPSSIVHSVLPFFRAPAGIRLILESQRKEVLSHLDSLAT